MDRNALARATESTDAPTPGYLYIDISKNAASSPTACREIVQYLTKRLQNKNHNVKYKSLKVLAKTAQAQHTRGQFKREVCQDPAAVMAIKECLNFRGPPDPLRGDEIYQRVRNTAKETLDAIYSDTPSSDDAVGAGMGGRTASYGNSPYGTGGGASGGGYGGAGPYSGGGGGGRMEGIGNPMFADPRIEAASRGKGIGEMTIGEAAGAAVDTIKGMIKDPLARNIPGAAERPMPRPGGGIPGYSGGGSGWTPPPGRNELSQTTAGQWTMASNRGPNAITPAAGSYDSGRDAYFKAQNQSAYDWAKPGQQSASSSSTAGPSRGGVGGSWANTGSSVGVGGVGGGSSVAERARVDNKPQYHQQNGSFGGAGGTAASDGAYEKNLIMELCPPGGMKAEPPEDKLEAFSRSVASLNPDLVCPALLDALEDGQPWIVRAKALCVMETTLKVMEVKSGESNPYSDFFHACSAEIEPLGSHPRAAVREPARRVLKALGIEVGAVPAGVKPHKSSGPQEATPAPAPAQAQATADLLDFGSEETAPEEPVAPPPASAPPEAPVTPLGDNGANPSNKGGQPSLFGGLNVQQAPAVAPSTEPGVETAPTASAAEVPAAAPSGGVALLDDSSPKDVKDAGGLFSDMSIKEAPTAATVSAPTPAVGGTEQGARGGTGVNAPSGFSFITEGASGAAGIAAGQQPNTSSKTAPMEASERSAAAPDASSTSGQSQVQGKQTFDPLLSMDWSSAGHSSLAQQQQQKVAQMQAMAAASYQQQQQMMMMQQMQMQQMMMQQQMSQSARTLQQHQQAGSGGLQMSPKVMRACSMRSQIPLVQTAGASAGGMGSFSFLADDTMAKKKEQEQKSFDFVKDAMKGAK